MHEGSNWMFSIFNFLLYVAALIKSDVIMIHYVIFAGIIFKSLEDFSILYFFYFNQISIISLSLLRIINTYSGISHIEIKAFKYSGKYISSRILNVLIRVKI